MDPRNPSYPVTSVLVNQAAADFTTARETPEYCVTA